MIIISVRDSLSMHTI